MKGVFMFAAASITVAVLVYMPRAKVEPSSSARGLDEPSATTAVLKGSHVTAGVSSKLGWQAMRYRYDKKRSLRYGATLDYQNPGRLLVRTETMGSQGQWLDVVYEFSASFEILRVTTAGWRHLYLWGKHANGDDVFEHWKYTHQTGQSHSVGGGGGSSVPAVVRTEIYRGSSLSPIRTFGVDPEQRYLMVAYGVPVRVGQLWLDNASAGVVDIFDEALIPNLASVTSMYPRQHTSEGRLWILTTFGGGTAAAGSPRTILRDADNDAVIDDYRPSLSRSEFIAAGYAAASAWDGHFIHLDW